MLHKLDKWTAAAIVIANMVGTGVFTSLGFQLMELHNAWSILFLWIIGGIIALSGAFTYAEIGTYLIRNGGEYHYLSKLFHPSLGFVAGFVSVFVGFAAPVAAASVAFGKYISYSFFDSSASVQISISLCILFLVSMIHLLSIKTGGIFQKYITLLKILIMLLFLFALFHTNANPNIFQFHPKIIFSDVISPAFAISLIYVSYAYSGWNAAAYVAGEIDNPQKNVSMAIVTGTSVVMVFYVLLNFCFLYSTPVQSLTGNVEIGIISANYIFGKTWGNLMGFLIALLLISTISSMIIAAPRVLASIGEDYPVFSFFSKRNKYHSPYISLLFIALTASVLIITSSFQWLINYIGITLILFSTFTASGIFILRKKQDYQPVFKVPFYPITPVFFIAMNVWILIYVAQSNFSALMASACTILAGFLIYKFIRIDR